MKLWLASGSPRRRTLLEQVGLKVCVCPQDVDERPLDGESAVAMACRLAASKAASAACREALRPDDVVLAADTVVHLGAALLGKPADAGEARRMLRRLSGGWHGVTTGFALHVAGRTRVRSVSTDVRFRELPDTEIEAWVRTGSAFDKAGAYAIQESAGVFVAELRGCWTNVMGLPVEAVLKELESCR